MGWAGGLFPRETSAPPQAAGSRYGALAPCLAKARTGLWGWQTEPQASPFPALAASCERAPSAPVRRAYAQPELLYSKFWPSLGP